MATIFRVVLPMWVLSPSYFLKVPPGLMDWQGCWDKQHPLVPSTLSFGDTAVTIVWLPSKWSWLWFCGAPKEGVSMFCHLRQSGRAS